MCSRKMLQAKAPLSFGVRSEAEQGKTFCVMNDPAHMYVAASEHVHTHTHTRTPASPSRTLTAKTSSVVASMAPLL